MHGIEIDGAGKAKYLHFAFLRMTQSLVSISLNADCSNNTFLHSFRDRRYIQRQKYFQSCFWKYDRAAMHVERCRRAIRLGVEGEINQSSDGECPDDPASGLCVEAERDLSLHLDSMLFYARMKADAVAQMIPLLYRRGGGIIPGGSLRDQRVWFQRKRPSFDIALSEILSAETAWLDVLAGPKPEALRDALVHRSAFHQTVYSLPNGEQELELRVGLVGRQGYIESNLISALEEIQAGFCSFLDALWSHFTGLLLPVVPDNFQASFLQTVVLQTNRVLPESFWVYPTFRSGRKDSNDVY